MFKQLLSFLFLLFLVPTLVCGQGWERTLGGENVDLGYSVLSTDDGGLITCGVTTSFGNDFDAIHIARLDPDGDEIWSNTYGEEGKREYGYSMIETNDGGFVVAGYQLDTSAGAKSDVYLLKIDALGNELWSDNYGGPDSDLANQVIEVSNGDLAIIGHTESFGNGSRDIYLLRTDADGEMLWDTTYGSTGLDLGYSLFEDWDGSFLLAGYYEDISNGNRRSSLTRVASNGDSLTTYDYGLASTVSGASIIKGAEDSYMLATYHDESVYLIKVRPDGSAEWEREVNDINIIFGRSLVATLDGGFAIAGGFEQQPQDDNVKLIKLDANGEEIWSQTFGGLGLRDFATSLDLMSDNGYGLIGFTRSFGSGFFDIYVLRTDSLGNVNNNFIEGNVYFDLNEDCDLDLDENGLHNWLVEVTGDETYYGLTDESGNYRIAVADGDYLLNLIPLNDYWQVSCGNNISLSINGPYDTTAIDFPVLSAYDCPLLEVDLSTPFLRRCYENQYAVRYCNDGTVLAEDAQVEVTLDEYLIVNGTTPIDWTSQDGNTYLFDVGDLDVGDCGEFYINVTVDCDSTYLGQTHCSEAHIYPDSLCFPTNNWSGASIELSASCAGDSVLFSITNVGDAPTGVLEYIIIEDHVILRTIPINNLPVDSTIIEGQPVEGQMLRLQGPQESGHPGFSQPSVSVEGCGLVDEDQYSIGYLTQYAEDDSDPFVSIDCQENVGSWDPNDKRGFPKGYRDQHFIEENTDLEYIIRFQNTGTDTAFRVVIRDTISPWLDVRRLQAGAASHPYELKIYDSGIVKFIFDDVNLPDSTTNEVASHGFVKLRIAQQPNNPIGTVIHNSAAIYFDFNEPVITNETFHTIGLDIIVGQPEIYIPETEVRIFPNPFRDWTVFEVKSEVDLKQSTFQLFNAQGQLVREESFTGNRFEFFRGQLQAGIYFYHIKSKQRLIFGGKLIAH